MPVSPAEAMKTFIENLEKEIDQELTRNYNGGVIELGLGNVSTISEETKKEIQKHYKEKGWEVSFKKKNPLWAWPFFYQGKEICIVLS